MMDRGKGAPRRGTGREHINEPENRKALEAARMLEDHPGQKAPEMTSDDQAEALSAPRKKRAKRVGYGD